MAADDQGKAARDWTPEQLNAFIDAALEADLGSPQRRSLLFSHIPPEIHRSLPVFDRPADQLRSDLQRLVRLSGDHFERWLDNAAHLSRGRPFAERVRAITGRPAPARPDVSGTMPVVRPARRRLTLTVVVACLAGLSAVAYGTAVMVEHFQAQEAREARKAAAQLVDDGRNLQRGGNPKAALEKFKAALALTPANTRYRAEAGWAAFKAGHRTEARALLEAALAQATDDAVKGAAAYNLGRLHEDIGEHAAAIEAYETSLQHRRSRTVEQRLTTLRLQQAR